MIKYLYTCILVIIKAQRVPCTAHSDICALFLPSVRMYTAIKFKQFETTLAYAYFNNQNIFNNASVSIV